MYKATIQILLVPFTLYRQLLRRTGCVPPQELAVDNHEASMRSSVERSSNMIASWQSHMARAREQTDTPRVARPEGWDAELDTQRLSKLTDGQLGGKMCDLRDEIQRSLNLRDTGLKQQQDHNLHPLQQA
ncbi:hypothetical protein O0I10_004050 [Lichtheimia ornata]|uniref:Uncharacterized protein n=1 Tax=Lichtheimia ornata TaxID=688661 RepID=A0AAD7V9R5_9FUNG|nr:uncharacterized protein O0I10_004050 [Lichtheimia ornata]KAJ8660191.1 hypothetical protein O0I10_004050 [Lichtheimia ornata]